MDACLPGALVELLAACCSTRESPSLELPQQPKTKTKHCCAALFSLILLRCCAVLLPPMTKAKPTSYLLLSLAMMQRQRRPAARSSGVPNMGGIVLLQRATALLQVFPMTSCVVCMDCEQAKGKKKKNTTCTLQQLRLFVFLSVCPSFFLLKCAVGANIYSSSYLQHTQELGGGDKDDKSGIPLANQQPREGIHHHQHA